jgi:hypothetical protein
MQGDTLIDFEEDLMGFESPKMKQNEFRHKFEDGVNDEFEDEFKGSFKADEFARPGERERRRGSLGSQGRRATKQANLKNEWDIFLDRFEDGCTV